MTAPAAVIDLEDTDDFNVRELIRDVIDSSGLADPGEIADVVLAKISDDDLRSALRSVLRSAVRMQLGHERKNLAEQSASNATGANRANQVRHWYERTLQMSLHVADKDGQPVWARFGDCTAAQLEFVANERREKARMNAAQALVYERVQAWMKTKRAKTVSDLSAEDLREAMAS